MFVLRSHILADILHIDFETCSLLDLSIVGVDLYARHPSTKVLMLAWAFNDEPVQLWQPHDDMMPTGLLKLLNDNNILIAAWNASFERNILKHVLKIEVPWERFRDPMVNARYLSLPGSLEDCGAVLGLTEDEAKIKDGKRLIKFFCGPYNFGGKVTLFGISPPEFHDWDTSPHYWKKLCEYCIRDVEVERTLMKMMSATPLPEREQKLWVLDQQINERGVPTNRRFVENAFKMAQQNKDELIKEMKEKSGLENPNSTPQLLPWAQEHGYPYHSLGKAFVTAALNNTTKPLPQICRDVLLLRQNTSKTAYTKLETLMSMLSEDDRLRNQFLFLGASRSGRWSGYGVQLHNLPRPIKWTEKHLELAIQLVDRFDYSGLLQELKKEKTPPSVIATCTSLIRSCFQAPIGKKLVVCDLNAIENRVLGWVTGCDSILKVFRDGLCPYISFATKIYNISYDILNESYEAGDADAKDKRQQAKSAVLGAGYGLGSGVDRFCKKCGSLLEFRDEACPRNLASHKKAGIQYTAKTIKDAHGNTVKTGLMGYAENMGIDLSPEQAYKAWKAFRDVYQEVVQGWYDMENAAVEVLKHGGRVHVGPVVFDRLYRKNKQYVLRITLPSGRALHYLNARLEIQIKTSQRTGKQYEKAAIFYDGIGHGVGQVSKGWGKVYTYGGKLMENVVQAISRDILADAMSKANEMGAEIVLHVHDEIGVLSDENDPFAFSLADLEYCMTQSPDWARDLPLGAAGYEGRFYKK